MPNKKKTLLVGLDAACWEYYQPLLDAGRLPVLAGLVREGGRGILRSTMPAWTPTAWASIATGKNPGKHGVFDMMWRRPRSYEVSPTNALVRLGTPFWTRLNEAGIRTGLVNVPFTHPPDPVEGFVVTGFGAPSGVPDFAYPPAVKEWIEDNYGPYEPWLRFNQLKAASAPEKMVADLAHQANQVMMAGQLAAQYAVDVLIINLMAPDHANHLLPELEQVEDVICQTDSVLGDLLASFQPDQVMLLSDHGARRVKGDFLLHVWLREQGYSVQQPRTPEAARNALNAILATWLEGRYHLTGLVEKVLRRLLVLGVPALPAPLADRFWSRLEQDIPFARTNWKSSGDLDTTRSPITLGSSRSGLIYLNIAGREPAGVLQPEEVPGFLQRFVADLRSLVDPESGDPIFTGVHIAEEIYQGAAAEYAPDVTLDVYDCPWNILATFHRGSYLEQVANGYFVGNQAEFGHHSRDGLFVFTGPDFQAGETSVKREMVDIPTTLLHLYGVPIPEDMDGVVMEETLVDGYLAKHPVKFQPGDPEQEFVAANPYNAEESAELMERLRMLGYLE
jgi:predicted AlkP superfamily phosphohydrolase/phosphomutase